MASTSFSARSRGESDVSCQANVVWDKVDLLSGEARAWANAAFSKGTSAGRGAASFAETRRWNARQHGVGRDLDAVDLTGATADVSRRARKLAVVVDDPVGTHVRVQRRR
jgi:hypothetical protein